MRTKTPRTTEALRAHSAALAAAADALRQHLGELHGEADALDEAHRSAASLAEQTPAYCSVGDGSPGVLAGVGPAAGVA